MPNVVVNRMEVEPAPAAAEAPPEAPAAEARAEEKVPRRDLERALRLLAVRRARVEAH